MANLRNQNKGLAGCPKRSEIVVGYLVCREWLFVSPKSKRGWLVGLKVEGGYIMCCWSRVIIFIFIYLFQVLDKFVLKTWISKRVSYFAGILSRV